MGRKAEKTVDTDKLIDEATQRLGEQCMTWVFQRRQSGKITSGDLVAFRKSPEFVFLSCAIGNLVLTSVLAGLERDGALTISDSGVRVVEGSDVTRLCRAVFAGDRVNSPPKQQPTAS